MSAYAGTGVAVHAGMCRMPAIVIDMTKDLARIAVSVPASRDREPEKLAGADT
jgi:sRNA-binding protein